MALMRLSRRAGALAGVLGVAIMIGSPSNKALMREAGLLGEEGESATANDLVFAIRARDAASGQAALEAAAGWLSSAAERTSKDELHHARSLAAGIELLSGANLALVSVPGEFAAREARRALELGLHALVFSDNVPIKEEIALKRLARAKGLLLMGPDCGTALIAGTPVAFANAVPRGDIGIVSASGTGLQEIATLVARAGGGITHGIGVGGRDLDARVGALATLDAIDALERDGATRIIVLVSKPPASAVARRVLARIQKSHKKFVVCFLGLRSSTVPANAKTAHTLREAAELALGRKIDSAARVRMSKRARGRWVRGLYCGGTLCAEAQVVFLELGLAVRSNAAVPGAKAPGRAGHLFLDLGEDEYTRGKPHPMLEPEIRNDHLREALASPETAVVLVDLVLGFGAHENPAGVLANALGAYGKDRAPVIASVTGTEADPQGYSRQVALLRAAGVIVAPSNAHAAELAASLIG